METRKLQNRKVAILMADGFETSEYTVPEEALRLAGADRTVISLGQGPLRGVHSPPPAQEVRVDLTVDQADAADFDALFIPGGVRSPDLLRRSDAALKFVREFDRMHKPIAALCHGPWVLASSELLHGRKITSYPGIRDDVVNAGAIWADQPVVRDGNVLTSRSPRDFAQFVPALIDFLAEPALGSGQQGGRVQVQPRR